MPNRTLKIPSVLYRAGTSQVKEDGSIRLSISSDVPYLRYDWMADEDYWEVLDHSPTGMDSSRLQAGAALLFNHKRDVQIGTISNPVLEGGRCYVDAKLSKADDVASYRTRIEEGILKDASVGYSIEDEGVCIGAKDGCPIYKFKWFPHEASLVTIPADVTVGVGRERNAEMKDFKEISVTSEKKIDVEKTLTEKPPTTKTMTPEEIEAARLKAIADHEKERADRVKKIRDFFKGLEKQPAWQKAVAPIMEKHIDGKADFSAFHEEALRAFPEPTAITFDGIEVGDERQQDPNKRQSIGEQFVRSKSFREGIERRGQGNRSATVDYDISILGIRGKAAMAQRAGFTSSDLSAVNVQIQQGVIGLGVQRLTIMDIIAPGTTGAAAIIYPQESSFGTLDGVAFSTSAGVMPKAGMVGERGVKPEWQPDLTTVTANVRKVAVLTKVPDEFMSDFPAAQSYIDERLPYMVDTRTEEQILYGDGVGNNLKGIYTFAGVQTRAVPAYTPGTDDWKIAQSLKQGLTDVSVGAMFEPDFYGFHPYDWETASLLRDTAGRFLAGGPFYIPYTNGVFMEMHTFWGKPCVISTAVAYGRPITGAGKLGAQYFIREGMRLEMTNANEDDFKRNLIAIRAEHRLALACYRPVAFLEFTNFPARIA